MFNNADITFKIQSWMSSALSFFISPPSPILSRPEVKETILFFCPVLYFNMSLSIKKKTHDSTLFYFRKTTTVIYSNRVYNLSEC